MWTLIGFSAVGGVVLAFAWVIYEGIRAPLRNDWESSGDTRWRKYREQAVLESQRAPAYVPENIMSLPHAYRPFDQEVD